MLAAAVPGLAQDSQDAAEEPQQNHTSVTDEDRTPRPNVLLDDPVMHRNPTYGTHEDDEIFLDTDMQEEVEGQCISPTKEDNTMTIDQGSEQDAPPWEARANLGQLPCQEHEDIEMKYDMQCISSDEDDRDIPMEQGEGQHDRAGVDPYCEETNPLYDTQMEDIALTDTDMDEDAEGIHCISSEEDGQTQTPETRIEQHVSTWVTPQSVGLYCQEQDAGNCAIHALNAMAGKQIITPSEAQQLLAHPDVPGPAQGQPRDCVDTGWYSIEAINKLLYFTTTIDLALMHVQTTAAGPPGQHTQQSILAHAPQGCTALYIHTPGHFVCWKQSPVNGKWYNLDSIPYAMHGQVKEVTAADWSTYKGTFSTTVQADAYLHNTTAMKLYRRRQLRMKAAQGQYIDLEQVTIHRGPTSRPAAQWIAADTAAYARFTHNLDEATAKQPPQSAGAKQDLPNDITKAGNLPQALDRRSAQPASSLLPTRRPQRPTTYPWYDARPLGIRVSRQMACHCGLHALEAVAGQPLATPQEVLVYLQETWPRGMERAQADTEAHYDLHGNYSFLALQRITWWF